MPTHFTKIEGSPSSNLQRERRRRRNVVSTSPAHGYDVSVSSIATIDEDWVYNLGGIKSTSHRGDCRDIPQLIHVENWRRPQQTNEHENRQRNTRIHTRKQQIKQRSKSPKRERRNFSRSLNDQNSRGSYQKIARRSNYDAYCETRVSAISSIPSQDGPGSSKISSLSSHGYSRDRKKRGDSSYDRYAVASPGRSRHRGKNMDYDRYAIASTGSDTGDPSALSPSSSRGRSSQVMYTFVNAHGVIGDNNIARNNNKQNLNARGVLNTTKKHRPISDSDGNPYFKLDPPTCRRIKAPIYDITDHESLESRNDFSLMGEKFADAGSALVVPNQKANAGAVSTADTAGSGTKWLCDVCKEARFDSYVEAFRHETQCRKIRNERLQFSTKTEKKASTQHRNSKIEFERGINNNNNKNNRIDITNQNRYNESEGRQWRGEFLENNLHHMSLSSSSDSDTSNQVNITTRSNITNRGQSGNGGGSILHGSVTSRESLRWLCSVCKEVSFNNYEEACNHEKICRIRMEATADMRMPVACIPTQTSRPIVSQTTADLQQAAENLKGNSAPLPLLEITESLEDANWQDPEKIPIPEGRQDRNDDREAITSLTRNETMDIIERERERCDRVVDTKEKNKNYTIALPESTIVRGLIPKDKGEAYDRYVNLASQQEEEEERDRLIALARETREEELESDRLGGGDERYVCLA